MRICFLVGLNGLDGLVGRFETIDWRGMKLRSATWQLKTTGGTVYHNGCVCNCEVVVALNVSKQFNVTEIPVFLACRLFCTDTQQPKCMFQVRPRDISMLGVESKHGWYNVRVDYM